MPSATRHSAEPQRPPCLSGGGRLATRLRALPLCLAAIGWGVWADAALAQSSLPITPGQRATAQQVAQSGVPLSELAPNAPDAHTVQRGDTLWAISQIFLKTPWRWPELWGMNLQEIRNPHLIYPGQVLVLERSGGRARLRLGQSLSGVAPGGIPSVKLSPRVRPQTLVNPAIAAIPLQHIGPFLNEAQVLSQDELAGAPRIVATQDGRVMVSRGETAYVRGDLRGAHDFTLFRESKPLKDPDNGEVLGFEAAYVGTAEFVRPSVDGDDRSAPVPASIVLTHSRQEAGIGDRLAPLPPRDFSAFVPHAPVAPLGGRIVSVYGEAVAAGQNQVVAINRGQRDGVERGHVLALWRAGADATDRTGERKVAIRLPDERVGLLFVFRVFERVSYALIVEATDPVRAGDRFSQP